jgi:hypothetical protein
VFVSVVLGISVISMFAAYGRGCGNSAGGTTAENPVAEVNGIAISGRQLESDLEKQTGGAPLPVNYRIEMLGSLLRQQINQALAIKLASDEGAEISVEEARTKIIQQLIESQRIQLIQEQKLRPDASQQEFESAYKAASGRSILDARKEVEGQIEKALAEPNGETIIKGAAASLLWIEKNKSKYMPTDQQIAEENKTIVIKEISVDATLAGKEKPEDKANAILKEIKGGLSFEGAMDKYLPKPADKRKKASDITKDVLESSIRFNPDLASLMTLKPGQMTGVVKDADGPSVIKIVRKGLPTDFDKRKDALKDRKATEEANKAFNEKLEKIATPENVKWHDEAFRVLYDYSGISSPSAMLDPNRTKKLTELIDRALEAQKKGTSSIAIGVAKLSMDAVIVALPPAKASELELKVLPVYVNQSPDPDVKVELAGLYVDTGKTAEAQAAISSAAVGVSAHQDESGKTYWKDLNAVIGRAKTKKILDDQQVSDLNKQYQDWQKAFAEAEKARKEAEAQQKADEARRKKLEEDLKKTGQKPVGEDEKAKTDSSKKPDGNKPEDKKPDGKP